MRDNKTFDINAKLFMLVILIHIAIQRVCDFICEIISDRLSSFNMGSSHEAHANYSINVNVLAVTLFRSNVIPLPADVRLPRLESMTLV